MNSIETAKEALFDLNDNNSSENVAGINPKKTRFVLPPNELYGYGELIFEIPAGWHDSPIVNLIIEYLYSNHFTHMSDKTKQGALFRLKKLQNFIENLDLIYTHDAALIYPKFHLYLGQRYSEYTAYKTFLEVRKVLFWAKDQEAIGYKSRYWGSVCIETLKRIPRLPFPTSEPKKTVSQVMKCEEVDDNELFISIRHYASYFINKTNDIRKSITEYDKSLFTDVENAIINYGLNHKGISNPIASNTFGSIAKHSDWAKHVINDIHPKLLRAIKALPDEQLLFLPRIAMTKLSSRSKLGKELGFNNLLRTGKLPNSKSITAHIRDSKGSKKIYPSYTLSELFLPTCSEEIAMYHLLATERIQPSGANLLQLTNCKLTLKSFQFCGFEKKRANKSFDSALYKSNTPIYEVYSEWFDMISKIYELSHHNRQGHFTTLSSTQVQHRIKNLSFSNLDWYAPLLFDGAARSITLQECPEAKTFCNAMLGNFYSVISTNGQHKLKVSPRPTLDSVAQSRVFFETQLSDILQSEVSDEIGASLTAHSLDTKINTYKDRTGSNNVVRAGNVFSSDVANFMEAQAQEASALFERTKVISIEEIESQIGYVTGLKNYSQNINDLLVEAEVNGYEVGVIGDISDKDETFVICTPIVSALIQGEISHINDALPKLEYENPGRLKVHQVRLMYLDMIIEQFDSLTREEGQKLLIDYNFPYPPLS